MIKIETERLILREYQKMDWEWVHQYAKQESILIYEAWGPNTEDDTKAFIEQSIKERKEVPRRAFELGIVLKNNKQLIGGCGFRINVNNKKRGNFGYIINPTYWNKGYATEASKGLLDFMITNHAISEIEATCDVLNLASKRVLEKCGLQKKKLIEKDVEMKGRFRDTFVFEKIIIEAN